MHEKEAKARIKINRLLEDAGWRFFDSKAGAANIVLEPNVKITQSQIDEFGENFERKKNGFVDFLLLDDKGFPLVILEAKAEDKSPLDGKEQARSYARSQNCRFVILSNGNLHYLWDLKHGNPEVISTFPTPESFDSYSSFDPKPERLVAERIDKDYIVLTQMPNYAAEAAWQNEAEREDLIEKNKLRFLRKYQLKALESIQAAVKEGSTRFLFEMATGTGKTLTAAAVIKLFLRTGNAKRILFLVDRLELEDQAYKAFVALLKNDCKTVIYKEQRDDWRSAEIVVSTVQSLLFNDKFKSIFSPTDFNLVISDEAHRSIGGNARALFDYFVGYKLGLTATPKDYLRNFKEEGSKDPRELEARMLRDTYRTFGCESKRPTFSYSLVDGVKDGFLINPCVVDARTEITTELLSEKGYSVMQVVDDGANETQKFFQTDFEHKFFSEATNRVLCETFLKNALRDPISKEFGKSIVFAVSQHHASKLTQILNKLADSMFPGKYNSDFAIQVTSNIKGSQQNTINFANNNLKGSANFLPDYRTCKARVCVTVGMMTTGYDCTDILNLALMRPVFSPSDFVQIKGRGTRMHKFHEQLSDIALREQFKGVVKTSFKLFDFFATCEYFETKFNYDEVIKLPAPGSSSKAFESGIQPPPIKGGYESHAPDQLKDLSEEQIGVNGMKIDRKFFDKFEDIAKADKTLKKNVADGQWDQIEAYVQSKLFDKPQEFFNLEKLRKASGVLGRRLSLREIIEKAFGLIPEFKSREDVLDDEFDKFKLDYSAELERLPDCITPMKSFFKAYATDPQFREIIDKRRFTELNVNSSFGMDEFKAIPKEWRKRIPEYIKDYVPLNQFM